MVRGVMLQNVLAACSTVLAVNTSIAYDTKIIMPNNKECTNDNRASDSAKLIGNKITKHWREERHRRYGNLGLLCLSSDRRIGALHSFVQTLLLFYILTFCANYDKI